jgi:SAM-dependent methyltransferase
VTSIGWYDANAEDFFVRSMGAGMLPQLSAFAALLPPGGRILEAGCGSGRDAKALKEMGFDVTATEAAPKLAALAEAHAGLPVQVVTFEQMVWRETFDGIWACASLLHVPRAELAGVLRRLRDTLVLGGVWFMSFKCGSEERLANGRRFTDLDEAGATALLAEAGGLELLALEVSGDVRPERGAERWLSVLCRRSA